MHHAVYIGPDPLLRGQGALVRSISGRRHGTLLAQFDDHKLSMAFGWHRLFRRHFRLGRRLGRARSSAQWRLINRGREAVA